MKERKLADYLIIAVKGAAMGAADAVPGVSGGTIAFISGIYEELITTIGNINLNLIKLVFKGHFKEFWQKANGNFVLALGIGVVTSFVTFMKLARYLLEHQPVLIWSFFFGLIVASIWFLGRQIKNWNAATVIALILGVIAAYFLTNVATLSGNDSLAYFFMSAAIAICAMILPGISGSFILIILGSYATMSAAIDDFDIKKLAIFVAGAVIGLLSFSKVLKWLLSQYNTLTMAVLTGFIIGSLNKIWPWKKVLEYQTFGDKVKVIADKNVWPNAFEGDPQLLLAITLGIIGFSLIFILERIASKK